jgi:tRNA pseudouridine13 synthase
VDFNNSLLCVQDDAWPLALGATRARGVLRAAPEDFRVDEVLGFDASGAGEFDLIQIEKRNANTLWVAEQVARFASVSARSVSFSGMKDRVAVTRQWLSVHLPGQASPDWSELQDPEFRVVSSARHHRKLRRGSHAENLFRIVIRSLHDPGQELEQRLETIAANGFPNYFGPQRFGHGGNNLLRAERLYSGQLRVKRARAGLLHSAARSLIFNQVLARRVSDGSWKQPLAGDVMNLDGRRSVFVLDAVDEDIVQRCLHQDIHPTGPLWGRGPLTSAGEPQLIEQLVADELPVIVQGLEQAGMNQERRPLRCGARELSWQCSDHHVVLEFGLPRGCFATALIRELVELG